MPLTFLLLALTAHASGHAPSLLLEKVETTGMCSPQRVAFMLERQKDSLLTCFADPSAAGITEIELRWAVGAGRVVSPLQQVGSSTASSTLVDCLDSVVHAISWPEPGLTGCTARARFQAEPAGPHGPTLSVDPALAVSVPTSVPGGGTSDSPPIELGALPKAEIKAVILLQMPAIRTCYQRALDEKPDLAGELAIKFAISKDGSVFNVEVKRTSMNDAEFESCVVREFQAMVFPEPWNGGIVIVSYPFIFSPG